MEQSMEQAMMSDAIYEAVQSGRWVAIRVFDTWRKLEYWKEMWRPIR